MRTPEPRSEASRTPQRASPARVYNVPPGRPFLDCLAAAILSGNLPAAGGAPPQPLELPRIRLYMPTRRAVRALQEAFLRHSGRAALLLPRIRPIGEPLDEQGLAISSALAAGSGSPGLDIAPPVGALERQLVLTELVMRWSARMHEIAGAEGGELVGSLRTGRQTPAQAAQLAAELARLMDLVETEGATLDGLSRLVPEAMSEHWQKTIEFLGIITAFWPQFLAERGLSAPMDYRNRVMLAEAESLARNPPDGPVIVAGVTGSIPATAALMETVARLPHGVIVLSGLDQSLDEASWQQIVPDHPEHPQFGLKRLIDRLGLSRGEVRNLHGAALTERQSARHRFMSEAMRPTATTGLWITYAERLRASKAADPLEGVSLIETEGAEEEAEAIALILRQAAETPQRTAALVSPDRLLARRVAVRLESWGIKVDDSAGRPFAKTTTGAFLDLVIETAASGFAPKPLMALLKHPMTRFGLAPFEVRRAARALELAVFRALYLGRGLDDVAAALVRARHDGGDRARRTVAASRLWPQDWEEAAALIERLRKGFAPLTALHASDDRRPLGVLAAAHIAAAESIARLPEAELPPPGEDGTPASSLWRDEAGETGMRFFAGLIDAKLAAPSIAAVDYADLYRGLVSGELVRPRVPVHPRLAIWGPFEARLQQPDIVILGSLNEGTWPAAADPGPWLNRPMRASLGLPSPEEALGHSAHDFVALVGAERVYLTRAQKVEGVPTVPSRWLMRMRALLAGIGEEGWLQPDEPWASWAMARDRIARVPPISAPEPRPPVAVRPRKLSVSRVETWIANPYAIYAREILRLEPLPPIGEEPQASLRGSVLHEALSRFALAHPTLLPDDIRGALVGHIAEVLKDAASSARVAAFWVPRFERFAQWFEDTERARRAHVSKVIPELGGRMILEAPAGPFTLTARADRIDVTDAGLVIFDYKTGALPYPKRVISGAAPQLPLEAAIALAGGFDSIPPLKVAALHYIRASGGEPPGEERAIPHDDIAALAAEVTSGLTRYIARFDDPATPYSALRRPEFANAFDDYAHLARVAEWSALAAPDEEA